MISMKYKDNNTNHSIVSVSDGVDSWYGHTQCYLASFLGYKRERMALCVVAHAFNPTREADTGGSLCV